MVVVVVVLVKGLGFSYAFSADRARNSSALRSQNLVIQTMNVVAPRGQPVPFPANL